MCVKKLSYIYFIDIFNEKINFLKTVFLNEKYDKNSLAIEFPIIIDQLKGTDANIEIIKSSQL